MTLRALAGVVAAAALLGCSGGGARPVSPAELAVEPGWVAVTTPPELRQVTASDCGPAALAMVAGHWNVSVSLKQATAAVPPPTERGVKLGHLRAAAHELGLQAFAIRADRETLLYELRSGRPVIVGLVFGHGTRGARSHYEVVAGFRAASDEVATIDPASGWRVRPWSRLSAEWEAAGRPALVVLGPSKPGL